MAKPTRSKETANPRKNGMESFWIEKNFNCADADTDTRSSKLIASFRIEIEMNGLVIISNWSIDKYKRVDGIVGMSHICQFMKERGRTINGFKMGDIVLFDPHRIYHSFNTILKAEVEDVFRMRIADGETEGWPTYQSIENCAFAVITRSDIEFDVFAVITRSDNW